MKIDKFEWAAIFSMLAFLIIVFWFMFSAYQDCNSEGGFYVRTLFWFACVN
jgi:hypothetical protein